MSGFFSTKSPLWRAMTWLADLIWLNILFLVCSLPIFTIGASLTAMYSVLFKLHAKEEGVIYQDFFKAFRSNFKQATLLWLILGGIGLFLLADTFMVAYLPGKIQTVAMYVLGAIGVFFLITFTYTFPLQSRFENPIKRTLMNAFVISIRHLFPTTFLAAILNAIPYAVIWFKSEWLIDYLPIVVLLAFSAIAFFVSKLLRPIFQKYIDLQEQMLAEQSEEKQEVANDCP